VRGMRRRSPVLPAAFVLLSFPVRADGLEDLRAILDRLGPAQPIRARMEIRTAQTENGRPKGSPRTSRLVVEHGAGGLKMERDPGESERAPSGKEGERPLGLSADEALALVDSVPALRRQLEGATLLSDSAGTRDGAPVRILALRPRSEIDEKARKSVKKWAETLAVTLDARGIPLSSEHRVDGQVSVFLVMSAVVSTRETKRYATLSGRLVVVSSIAENAGSAFGRKGEARTEITVTPL
jgi:hypothetical protein